jgi:nucleoside phosphorylase/phosphoglycolate phosphatase-like HAD superfamily hydrolase
MAAKRHQAEGAPAPTIGVVTALPEEFAAFRALLDDPAELPEGGTRLRLTRGRIENKWGDPHQVVLPLVGMGNNMAAANAAMLLDRFDGIRYLVMTGIAGGVPHPSRPDEHVRLGDIVVSGPQGIIQYDFNKETADEIVYRSPPRPPSARLLNIVGLLEADELTGETPWWQLIDRALSVLRTERPPESSDVLVASDDPARRLDHPQDPRRVPGRPRLFVGAIASGNKLLKNPLMRDKLRDRFSVRAVEMEGSGIADATWNQGAGYIVVRGISDYCDSRKSDGWKLYAAVTAASFARALIESLPVDTSVVLPTGGAGHQNRESLSVFAPSRTAQTLYGREAEIQDLLAFVQGSEQLCFLTGLGGVGKTAILLELVHRLSQLDSVPVRAVVFVAAPSGRRARTEAPTGDGGPGVEDTHDVLRRLAIELKVPNLNRLPPDQLLAALRGVLEGTEPVLLLIDNWEILDDKALLRTLCGLSDRLKILVASRGLPDLGCRHVVVEPLAREDAAALARELLGARIAGMIEPERDRLAHEAALLCADHPLAIHLLVPYVRDFASLRALKRQGFDLAVGHSAETLASYAVEFSCGEVRRRQPRDFLALEVLAFFSGPIATDALEAILRRCGGDPGATPRLRQYHLITLSEVGAVGRDKEPLPLVGLHPLVHHYLHSAARDDDAKRILEAATETYIEILQRWIGNPYERRPEPPQYGRIEPHAPAVFELIRRNASQGRDADVIRLVDNLGYFFRVREYWREGEELWSLASVRAAAGGDELADISTRFSSYVVYLQIFRGTGRAAQSRITELFDALLARTSPSAAELRRRSYLTGSLLRLFGLLAKEDKRPVDALRFLGRARAVMEAVGSLPGQCRILNDIADLTLRADPEGARRLVAECERKTDQARDQVERIRARRLLGEVHALLQDLEPAGERFREALALCAEVGMPDERFLVLDQAERHGLEIERPVSASPAEDPIVFAPLLAWVRNRPASLPADILRCVILDWSGVIADDLEETKRCQLEVLAAFGTKGIEEGAWERLTGANWREFLGHFIEPPQRKEAFARYRELVGATTSRVLLLPNARPALTELVRRGYRAVLYTSQLKEQVRGVLHREELEPLFDELLICDELGSVKPSAGNLGDLLSRRDLRPGEAVLVDDSADSLAVGRELGLRTVVCPSILSRRVVQADLSIESIGALPDALRSFDE